MKSKKEGSVLTVNKIGNGRAKFNRIIRNIILYSLGMEKKLPSVSEMNIEGIFSNMQKEKSKLEKIMESQKNAVILREKLASKIKEESDKEVEILKKKIEEAKDSLQNKIAIEEKAKKDIVAEMERAERISKRMCDFLK